MKRYNPRRVRAKPVLAEFSFNGRYYKSKTQYRRAVELHLLERAGVIRNLREEVAIPLYMKPLDPRPGDDPKGKLICHYIADAVYEENGVLVIEDTKSEGTATDSTFRLKADMIEAQYGITVRHHGAEYKRRRVRTFKNELVPVRR